MSVSKLENGILRGRSENGNSVSNSDGSTDTTGYALYSDAAGTSPVDATGGSVNTSTELNFTRNTTNPLNPPGDFLFSKKSGNQQGKGVSYLLTIPKRDKYRLHTISFSYYIASGTYTDDEVRVFLVDTTSGEVKEPTNNRIKNATIENVQRCEVQVSGNTSYRLAFHVSGTSSSAYDIQLDDITLAPEKIINGVYTSDMIPYTPTITASSGSLTNYTATGFYRQDGDMIYATGQIQFTGAAGTWAAPEVSLPPGLSFDTSKMPSLAIKFGIGNVTLHDGGTSDYTNNGKVAYLSATKVALSWWNVSNTAYTTLTQAVPFAFASGDYIQWEFQAPILGWSSGTTYAANGGDGRVVAARAYLASTQTGINPNGSHVKINFDTRDFDTHASWDTTNKRYNVPVTGTYEISSFLYFSNTNVLANSYLLAVYKNGSLYSYIGGITPAVSTQMNLSGSTEVQAVAGDYLEIYLYGAGNNSSSTLSCSATSSVSHVSIKKVQGPSAIAAGESVNFSASTSAAPTVNSTPSAIAFATIHHNSHNAWSTDTFTAPVSGKYRISASLMLNAGASMSTTTVFYVQVYKNGSSYKELGRVYGNGQALNYQTGGSITVNLNVNDTLKLYAACGASQALYNDTVFNHIHIERVGN